MPEHRWLHLCLEAPLLAFGGVRIDHIGPTRDFPAASMLTGLLANALGLHRSDWQAHQRLQDRLLFASRQDRAQAPGILLDMQNAKLEKNDRGWTTWGVPEGRDGASYGGPHRRERYYHMDASVTVVLRLGPAADGAPALDTIEAALERPARPLFVGRKPCLPSGPLLRGAIIAADAHMALTLAGAYDEAAEFAPASWPYGEGPESGDMVGRVIDLADVRNWRTGLHAGTRRVVEGRVATRGGNQ